MSTITSTDGLVLYGPQLQENRRGELYGAFISTYALATIVTGLRFLSRRVARANIWLDDWMCLAAFIFCSAQFGMLTYGVWRGLGTHIFSLIQTNSYADIQIFYKILLAEETLYNASLLFIKLSILALYWRLFHPARYMRIFLFIAAPVVVAWSFALLIVTLVQCMPLSGFFTRAPGTPGESCHVSEYGLYLTGAIIHIVADVFFLLAPIPAIWSLPRPTAQKIALIGMFLLGGFVCVVSVFRLWKLLRLNFASFDLTWSFVDIAMWSVVETNIALVSASLPSLRPILSYFAPGFRTSNESKIGPLGPGIDDHMVGKHSENSTTLNESEPKYPSGLTKYPSGVSKYPSGISKYPSGVSRMTVEINEKQDVESNSDKQSAGRKGKMSFSSFDFEVAQDLLNIGRESGRPASLPKSPTSPKIQKRIKVSPEKLQAIEAFDDDYEVFPETKEDEAQEEIEEEKQSPYQIGVEAARKRLKELKVLDEDDFDSFHEGRPSSSYSVDEIERIHTSEAMNGAFANIGKAMTS